RILCVPIDGLVPTRGAALSLPAQGRGAGQNRTRPAGQPRRPHPGFPGQRAGEVDVHPRMDPLYLPHPNPPLQHLVRDPVFDRLGPTERSRLPQAQLLERAQTAALAPCLHTSEDALVRPRTSRPIPVCAQPGFGRISCRVGRSSSPTSRGTRVGQCTGSSTAVLSCTFAASFGSTARATTPPATAPIAPTVIEIDIASTKACLAAAKKSGPRASVSAIDLRAASGTESGSADEYAAASTLPRTATDNAAPVCWTVSFIAEPTPRC